MMFKHLTFKHLLNHFLDKVCLSIKDFIVLNYLFGRLHSTKNRLKFKFFFLNRMHLKEEKDEIRMRITN